MSGERRENYYKRCQEIIDDIHDRVARGEFISEQYCIRQYGNSDYNALLHELRIMKASQDWTTMTPAMEWLYHSQYFTNKANEELAAKRQRKYVYLSAWAAVLSAFCSLILCCKGCYDAKHTNAYKQDASHYESDIIKNEAKVGESGTTDEVLDVARQIPDNLNDQAYETKDTATDTSRKNKSQ